MKGLKGFQIGNNYGSKGRPPDTPEIKEKKALMRKEARRLKDLEPKEMTWRELKREMKRLGYR